MNVFEQLNSSYCIITSERIDDVISVLYAKDYKVIPIKTYYNGLNENSALFFNKGNDELRSDIIFILNHFKENSSIIKYSGESCIKRIKSDGSESLLELIMYNTEFENVSYIYDNISFSFKDANRYWKPSKKEDFKTGMIVEYLNNNKWCQKRVVNPNIEFDNMYKLLIKYDKVRVLSK